MTVIAVQQVRRMRGGAQSHLMLGADDNLYVVKFKNNPQHLRVLANELLATRLAEAVGLTVPVSEVIEVSEWLISNTPELDVELAHRRERCLPGLQFGSRYIGGMMPGRTSDYLEEDELIEVKNLSEFAGMLALDKWTCNANGRQATFSRKVRENATSRPSLIRVTVSTRASGSLPTRRCAGFTHATASIARCGDGKVLSPGWGGSKRCRLKRYGRSPKVSPRSGMEGTLRCSSGLPVS